MAAQFESSSSGKGTVPAAAAGALAPVLPRSHRRAAARHRAVSVQVGVLLRDPRAAVGTGLAWHVLPGKRWRCS